MKTQYFLIVCVGISLSRLSANAQDTTWIDKDGQHTTPDKALYYLTKVKSDQGWATTGHYLSGKTRMKGTYTDDSLEIAQGTFNWFDDMGNPSRICSFVQNRPEGSETFFYPSGRKKMTGSYSEGERDGEWVSYYPNGKMAGKATFAKGKEVSSLFFDMDGTPNKKIKSFFQAPEFPGGQAALTKYLNKNITYPDYSFKHNIQGTVIVEFKLTKDGLPTDFKVIQSVEKNLDGEAVNVIRQMPEWQPFILGGIPTEHYIKQPIVFTLHKP